MGERKGVNKYYPPDYDPSKGGLNKWQGTHALRERARKIHVGIIIIRFEMPYNIWCDGCGNHIGMGVRYNAEKKKVGMYYSTPVYQFRMKCHLCDNHFEIKTDPANLDYEIVSGARRQERRFDPAENGTVVPDDRREIQKMATDSMYKLEHGADDVQKLKQCQPGLARLQQLQDRNLDHYSANRLLRQRFKAGKRSAEEGDRADASLLKRCSLDLPLLAETDEDRRLASLLRLQDPLGVERRRELKRQQITSRPALGSAAAPAGSGFSSQPGSAAKGLAASLGVVIRRGAAAAATCGRSDGTASSSAAGGAQNTGQLSSAASESVATTVSSSAAQTGDQAAALLSLTAYSSSSDSADSE